jgi:hypothetical protein
VLVLERLLDHNPDGGGRHRWGGVGAVRAGGGADDASAAPTQRTPPLFPAGAAAAAAATAAAATYADAVADTTAAADDPGSLVMDRGPAVVAAPTVPPPLGPTRTVASALRSYRSSRTTPSTPRPQSPTTRVQSPTRPQSATPQAAAAVGVIQLSLPDHHVGGVFASEREKIDEVRGAGRAVAAAAAAATASPPRATSITTAAQPSGAAAVSHSEFRLNTGVGGGFQPVAEPSKAGPHVAGGHCFPTRASSRRISMPSARQAART